MAKCLHMNLETRRDQDGYLCEKWCKDCGKFLYRIGAYPGDYDGT
jgi:hypothetical protein